MKSIGVHNGRAFMIHTRRNIAAIVAGVALVGVAVAAPHLRGAGQEQVNAAVAPVLVVSPANALLRVDVPGDGQTVSNRPTRQSVLGAETQRSSSGVTLPVLVRVDGLDDPATVNAAGGPDRTLVSRTDSIQVTAPAGASKQ
jgi:hypothetical protein